MLNKMPPPLEAKIKQTIQHAKLLRSIEVLDARFVLDTASEFLKESGVTRG